MHILASIRSDHLFNNKLLSGEHVSLSTFFLSNVSLELVLIGSASGSHFALVVRVAGVATE